MRIPFIMLALLLTGLAPATFTAAQAGPQVKGRKVAIAGENPFISLSLEAGGKSLTSVSFWRVVYSPAGAGHACYLRSDVTGNGPTADDVRVVYTDNPALVEYLNREIMSAFDPGYRDNPYPVQDAVFGKKGSPPAEYREVVTAGSTKVELLWRDFHPPVLMEIPVKPFIIFTTLIPSKTSEVYINGIKAAGRVFPRPEGTAQGSSGSLAFCETWVQQ